MQPFWRIRLVLLTLARVRSGAIGSASLFLLLRGACRPCRQRETGCCTFCAAARWSFLLFCQLFIQPCGDICKNLQLVGLQQQLVAGTGVEDAFNVQHTGVLQALDGAAHALALLAHRVGIAGEEEQRQNDRAVMDAYGFVKGTEARTSESACVAELMKLYQKLTETK